MNLTKTKLLKKQNNFTYRIAQWLSVSEQFEILPRSATFSWRKLKQFLGLSELQFPDL